MAKRNQEAYEASKVREVKTFNKGYEVEIVNILVNEKKDKETGVIYSEELLMRLRNVDKDKPYDVYASVSQDGFKAKLFNVERMSKDKDGNFTGARAFHYDKLHELYELAIKAGCKEKGIDEKGMYPAEVWENGKIVEKDVLQYANLIKGMKGKTIGAALKLYQKYPRKLINGWNLAPVPKDLWQSKMKDPENVWVQDASLDDKGNVKMKPIFTLAFFYDIKTGKRYEEIAGIADEKFHTLAEWELYQREESEMAKSKERLLEGVELSNNILDQLKLNYKIAKLDFDADFEELFDHSLLLDEEVEEDYGM